MLTRRDSLGLALAGALFLASLALYTWTLAPTVTLVDSGELILAAHGAGVAHPPGFPLYLMLAHLAAVVPIGSVAVRINFVSALCGALAISVIMLLTAELMHRGTRPGQKRPPAKRDRLRKTERPSASARDDPPPDHWLAWAAPSVMSALIMALSRTLWTYATVAEVYTLNTLLIALTFVLLFRWRRRVLDEPAGTASADLPLYAAAFVFGLALGVHHVTVALMLPALAVVAWRTGGRNHLVSRRVLFAAACTCVGLATYIYLPIAAARSPLMNWGDPRTLERVWWHVTAKQYRANLAFSLASAASQFGEFVRLTAREFGPSWLPLVPSLAVAGLVALYRGNRTLFWFLIVVIAADVSYALGYDIAEDKDAYFLPAFVALAIAAGFGTRWLSGRLRPTSRALTAAIAAALALVPLSAFLANLPYTNRSRYFIASDYVDNIMAAIEPRGMLLTSDWQVYSPMLYTREIEHRRDDVVVIDINLLRRSWYYGYLTRAYPKTLAQARTQVDSFLEELHRWEHEPDVYERDVALNQRINARFDQMVMAFVGNHQQSGRVYVTLDIADGSAGQSLPRLLAAANQFLPRGLVFQLSRGPANPAAPVRLVTRGLNDGTVRFDRGDVVTLKVLPVYASMIYNQGRHLAAAGRRAEAMQLFKDVLAIDPGFIRAQQALDDSPHQDR